MQTREACVICESTECGVNSSLPTLFIRTSKKATIEHSGFFDRINPIVRSAFANKISHVKLNFYLRSLLSLLLFKKSYITTTLLDCLYEDIFLFCLNYGFFNPYLLIPCLRLFLACKISLSNFTLTFAQISIFIK